MTENTLWVGSQKTISQPKKKKPGDYAEGPRYRGNRTPNQSLKVGGDTGGIKKGNQLGNGERMAETGLRVGEKGKFGRGKDGKNKRGGKKNKRTEDRVKFGVRTDWQKVRGNGAEESPGKRWGKRARQAIEEVSVVEET